MSQNKTVIQGINSSGDGYDSSRQTSTPNFYQRGSGAPAKGTVVPGMMEAPTQPGPGAPGTYANYYEQPQQPMNMGQQAAPKKKIMPGKPVVGFLYSVSRTPAGEFWPLHIGPNTIGQSAESDILLAEGTVSFNHAVIVTRKVKNGVIAAITDAKSSNGTMINGEIIGFGAEECHNGDILTIGNNYELVLLLVDTIQLGLNPKQEFIPVDVAEEPEEPYVPDFQDMHSRATRPGQYDNPGMPNPFAGPGQPNWGGGGNMGGTVGLDGRQMGGNSGGTVPM